jgi:hypothetical protein
VVLFEEWGWEPLAALFARLARLPLWAALEAALRRLPPWGAALAFFVPAIALLPVKLAALFLLGGGHALLGAGVLLVAKVAGTALLARLFELTRPTLLRVPWFAHWYPRWKAWKDGILARVRASRPWALALDLGARARDRWARRRQPRLQPTPSPLNPPGVASGSTGRRRAHRR